MLGLWGAYMPSARPRRCCWARPSSPRRLAGWWWLLARCPRRWPCGCGWPCRPRGRAHAARRPAARRIARTLRSPGPWLAATAFAAYSAQWLAVIGFLPTIYAQAGLPTACARWRRRSPPRQHDRQHRLGPPAAAGRAGAVLLQCGFAAMALGAIVAFAPWAAAGRRRRWRYAACCCSPRGRPGAGHAVLGGGAGRAGRGTVSTTVGWMQQWSAFGQFAGPPLVAWAAARPAAGT
jgi:hypothetical protein